MHIGVELLTLTILTTRALVSTKTSYKVSSKKNNKGKTILKSRGTSSRSI